MKKDKPCDRYCTSYNPNDYRRLKQDLENGYVWLCHHDNLPCISTQLDHIPNNFIPVKTKAIYCSDEGEKSEEDDDLS